MVGYTLAGHCLACHCIAGEAQGEQKQFTILYCLYDLHGSKQDMMQSGTIFQAQMALSLKYMI
jgi:hypothetical protein